MIRKLMSKYKVTHSYVYTLMLTAYDMKKSTKELSRVPVMELTELLLIQELALKEA